MLDAWATCTVLNKIHEHKWIKYANCSWQIKQSKVLSFSFSHLNEMILCKYDDFTLKVTSISFPFCDDADVIGVNLIPFLCSIFSCLVLLVLSFCWLYCFVEHLRTVFLCSKNVQMRILIYSLLFRVHWLCRDLFLPLYLCCSPALPHTCWCFSVNANSK